MKIAFNPSTVEALTTPPNNKDITFDLRGHNIFARGVKFCGTDTNTWRDIKINNVSIDSNTLDLRDGSNTTLTNINGVVTINSTWRPVVDNLTSDSTTSSLSANQGRILVGLINGKSDSEHNHDDRYVKKTGDTMFGALNFANGTWNLVGDDSYMGDCNISGHFGIKAANTTYPGISFFNNANAHLGNLTAYSGNIKYGAYSLQFLDNGNTNVSAGTWMNPFNTYNASAVADGQAICVWGQSSYLSNLAADSGDMSLWLKRVNSNVATLNMVLDGEYYANGNQRLAHVSEIPNSLKNPYALTISLNGTSQGPYDGSAAKNINITPSSIGAAVSNHSHNYAANENYGGFTKSERLPISGFYQSYESESGGNAPWSGWMHLINCQHSNTGNNYALQIAASFSDNNTFKIRVTQNNVNNAWRDIIHSGNIGNQTVANAYHLRINSANTWSTWYWEGQSGQPSWLWGSNDGTNMYVWNPSNFRVAYASSAGNADTVDGYHISDESRQVYRNYYTVASPASAWILIKLPAWNANNEIVAIDGYGDNRQAHCVVHCGSRYQGLWGYQSEYNGIVVTKIRWKQVDSGKFAIVALISGGIINLSIKSTSSLEISKTTEDNAAFAISSSFFSSGGVFHGNVDWDNITGKPSSFTPSAHTHSWTSITDKLADGNEFNIVNAGFNGEIYFNYLPINDRNGTATINRYHFKNGKKGYTLIEASGFIKNGSSSSYVLLGDGGHKAENALNVSNADTVDGEHASNFSYTHQSSFDFNTAKSGRIVTFDESNTKYGWINGFASTHNNYLTSIIFNTHRTSNWYVGYIEASNGVTKGLSAVKQLAFVDSNIASATKLQTPRTIWGQSFDGTGNVDNTLRIRQTTGNYCEGIRIQTADSTWATIILGATGDSGTNANAWSIHRKSDNNFAISRNSSDGTNGLVMTSVGMGLGTTAPAQRLDVHGNIRATGNSYATHFYESSDKTLKKNIKSILSSANIPKIREFDWEDTGEHSYGFIAQELEEQGYGCLVNEVNGKKTVNYTATLALTVAKLQNLINIQNKKISNLTKELKALKYGRKKNS